MGQCFGLKRLPKKMHCLKLSFKKRWQGAQAGVHYGVSSRGGDHLQSTRSFKGPRRRGWRSCPCSKRCWLGLRPSQQPHPSPGLTSLFWAAHLRSSGPQPSAPFHPRRNSLCWGLHTRRPAPPASPAVPELSDPSASDPTNPRS